MHNIQYTIKRIKDSKPARYQVMLGNCPMSRELALADARQYLSFINGEIDSVSPSFQQTRTGNVAKQEA